MPSSSWTAANAECDAQQNSHSLSPDTWAAISSRSPRDNVEGPRNNTSASSFNGFAVSGRYLMGPLMPGNSCSSTPRSMCAMPRKLATARAGSHR
jgi:hypothetical protein